MTQFAQDQREEDVWLHTEPVGEGRYELRLSVGGDDYPLDAEAAQAHAGACFQVIARANFDTALTRQLFKINDDGEGEEGAAEYVAAMVSMLRQRREPVDFPLPGLTFQDAVNQDLRPFIIVNRDGEPDGQITVEALAMHAAGVLEALHTTSLEQDYRAVLVESVGLSEEVAGKAVGSLLAHRVDLMSEET